uniref:Uncharacterized protein n=1 Tax=Clastoptera arizonana TaxID=38151 RepID=A0A1B6DD48_9HEMI
MKNGKTKLKVLKKNPERKGGKNHRRKKQLRAKLRREQFRANQTTSDTGKKKKKNKISRKMRMKLRQERLNPNKSLEDTGNRFNRFPNRGRYEERGARRYDNDRNRYRGRSRYGDNGGSRYRDRDVYRRDSRYGDRYGRRDRFDDRGDYDRGRGYGGGRWNDRYNKYGYDNYRSNYRDRYGYDNYRGRYREDGYRNNYRNDRNSYGNDRNSYRDNYRDRYRSDNRYRDTRDGDKDFRLKYKGHDYYDSRFDRNREIKGPEGDENKYAKKGKRYDIYLDDYVSDEAYKDKNKDSVKKEISSKDSGKNEKNQNDKNKKNTKTQDDKNKRDKRTSINYDMSDERHDASLMQSSTSGKTLKYQRGQGLQRDANWRRAMNINPYEQSKRYKREDKIQEDSKSEAPEVRSNSVRRRRRKRTRELVGLGPRKVNIKDFLYDKVMETGPQVEFEEEEWVEWLGNRRIGRVKFDVNGVTLEPITWDQKLMLDNWHNFQRINRERKKEMKEIRERAKLKQMQESLTTENNEVKKVI